MNPFTSTRSTASEQAKEPFLDIGTSKIAPRIWCFAHFDLQMCFASQRRASFHVSAWGSTCTLDERKKAYRQVVISPAHRKFSVICLKGPEKGRVAFFLMIGHSFGLVSAVYNYNHRSAAINEIMVRLFNLVAFSFYDGKYGFETVLTALPAHQVAQSVGA